MALFKFAKAIMGGKPVVLYNNGDMKRSFTHVDDVVAGIVTILEQAPQKRNLVFNLGGAEAVPLKRFVELIEREIGKSALLEYAPLQAGDVPETVADCTLAERELDFLPRVSIEEGIKRFATWFRMYEKWLCALETPKQ
jgi:UDP-glucuronate 4-epimerase